MLKRLWLVLSVLWALALVSMVAADRYMSVEVQTRMTILAMAPFLIGPVVWRLGRFVVRGG